MITVERYPPDFDRATPSRSTNCVKAFDGRRGKTSRSQRRAGSHDSQMPVAKRSSIAKVGSCWRAMPRTSSCRPEDRPEHRAQRRGEPWMGVDQSGRMKTGRSKELRCCSSLNSTTPEAGRAFIEQVIFPTLARGEQLMSEKKIVGGGAVVGRVSLRFIIHAETP
jgi:hypothetical protein